MNTSSFLYPDITLRAPEPEDIDFMFACENDTELWKSGINTGPYSRYQLKKYIAENQNDLYEDKQLGLMIELQTKETVGIIDLFSFSTRHLRAEIGIVISKNYRRKNIASAALSLLETHCFATLGLHQLYAYICKENIPCMQLFKKSGYNVSCILSDWYYIGAKYHDVCLVQKINPSIK